MTVTFYCIIANCKKEYFEITENFIYSVNVDINI